MVILKCSSLGKGSLNQYSGVYALSEQDYIALKEKKKVRNDNPILEQILNDEQEFALKETVSKGNKTQFDNMEEYLLHLSSQQENERK